MLLLSAAGRPAALLPCREGPSPALAPRGSRTARHAASSWHKSAEAVNLTRCWEWVEAAERPAQGHTPTGQTTQVSLRADGQARAAGEAQLRWGTLPPAGPHPPTPPALQLQLLGGGL